MISDSERDLINEVIKCFIVNQWAITPEAIAAFIRGSGENIDIEKVHVVYQENMTQGRQR